MEKIKINFKNLLVEAEIGKFVKSDLRAPIGNELHRFAMTIPVSDLAKEIYYSEGEVEIHVELIPEIMEILSHNTFVFVRQAIKNEIDKQLKNKEK